MKTGIHPQWHNQAQVVCSCGNIFSVGSTKATIRTEVCYKCHPFFTGQMKYVDIQGRVERFQRRQKAAASTAAIVAEKRKKKQEKQTQARQPKTLREMLMGTP